MERPKLARKIKPRWGWEHTHDGKDCYRREGHLDWDWLIHEIGEGDSSAAVTSSDYLSYTLDTFYMEQFEGPGPSGEEMEAAFREISQTAALLKEKLEGLDQSSKSFLGSGYDTLSNTNPPRFSEEELMDSATQFSWSSVKLIKNIEVFEAAVSALKFRATPKTKGKKPQMAIKNLIYRVSELCREYSDQAPLDGFYRNAITERYEGRFVAIMEHIFGKFAPELNLTNAAIGEQIRRTIGDRS
jgi:hypothetical protein